MSTPVTNSNRIATKLVLQSMLAEKLAPLPVGYGFPKTPEVDGAEILETTGTYSFRNQKALRKFRKDEFRVHVWFHAGLAGRTAEEADEACVAMFNALDDLIAENPTLQSGLGITWAGLDQVDGPSPLPNGEGYESHIDAYVLCHAELT